MHKLLLGCFEYAPVITSVLTLALVIVTAIFNKGNP